MIDQKQPGSCKRFLLPSRNILQSISVPVHRKQTLYYYYMKKEIFHNYGTTNHFRDTSPCLR